MLAQLVLTTAFALVTAVFPPPPPPMVQPERAVVTSASGLISPFDALEIIPPPAPEEGDCFNFAYGLVEKLPRTNPKSYERRGIFVQPRLQCNQFDITPATSWMALPFSTLSDDPEKPWYLRSAPSELDYDDYDNTYTFLVFTLGDRVYYAILWTSDPVPVQQSPWFMYSNQVAPQYEWSNSPRFLYGENIVWIRMKSPSGNNVYVYHWDNDNPTWDEMNKRAFLSLVEK